MHHFFADPSCVEDGWIRIEGADAAHMGKVLRMRPGEGLLVSDGEGRDYLCRVEELAEGCVYVRILEEREQDGEPGVDAELFGFEFAASVGGDRIAGEALRNPVQFRRLDAVDRSGAGEEEPLRLSLFRKIEHSPGAGDDDVVHLLRLFGEQFRARIGCGVDHQVEPAGGKGEVPDVSRQKPEIAPVIEFRIIGEEPLRIT